LLLPKLIFAEHLEGHYIHITKECYKAFTMVLAQLSAGSGFERKAGYSTVLCVSIEVWHLLFT